MMDSSVDEANGKKVVSEEERMRKRAARFGLEDEHRSMKEDGEVDMEIDAVAPSATAEAIVTDNASASNSESQTGQKRSRLAGRLGTVKDNDDGAQKTQKRTEEQELERHLDAEEAKLMQELGVTARTQGQIEHKVVSKLEQLAEEREKDEQEAKAKKDEEKRQAQIAMLKTNVANIEKKLKLPAYSSQPQQEALQKQMMDVRAKLKTLKQQSEAAMGPAVKEKSDAKTSDSQKRATASAVLTGKAETERERMIRTGMITPFSGREGSERIKLPQSPQAHAQQPPAHRRSDSGSSLGRGSAAPPLASPRPALPPRSASVASVASSVSSFGEGSGKKRRVERRSSSGKRDPSTVDDADEWEFQHRVTASQIKERQERREQRRAEKEAEKGRKRAEKAAKAERKKARAARKKAKATARAAGEAKKRRRREGEAVVVVDSDEEVEEVEGDEERAGFRAEEIVEEGGLGVRRRSARREGRGAMERAEERMMEEALRASLRGAEAGGAGAGGREEAEGTGKRKERDGEEEEEEEEGEGEGEEGEWEESESESESEEESEEEEEEEESSDDEVEDMEELLSGPMVEFDGGYQIPEMIFTKLFAYQQTSIKWMWELHCQEAGGIIGDEMGLGKTVQIVSFLAGLHCSQKLAQPVLILCPATIMAQWVREFHRWYPPLRVLLLHESGASKKNPRQLLSQVVEHCAVLVTTYEQMRIQAKVLTSVRWAYVVLDEGHKIRNPDAEITQAVKGLDTPHRLLLSGAPIQNKLVELWSLFDFVFPGRLGTLPVFETEFSKPIAAGGFANATELQVDTAYRCALVLRDLIDPYLLRRMKADVQIKLPEKSEQVLFCKLTPPQRRLYEQALSSPQVQLALEGRAKVFAALTHLRKICSHPDLLHVNLLAKPDNYGDHEKSTKMQLLAKILPLWKTRQMLDILEGFVKKMGLTYARMDGLTTIKSRQTMIDHYNNNASVFCFLLTTKVGGLGTNLVGADRVILYDPDWNPSTDMQARERAWRIGQKKQVTIYRLVVSGTIEEKMYHRQIYKQFLTNKILKDPKQRRFFKVRDLHDLFTLGDDAENGTETGDLFGDVADEMLPEEASQNSTPGSSKGKGKKSAEQNGREKIRQEDYVPPAAEEEDQKGETQMLKKLLNSDAISSAMSHDQILDGATGPAKDSLSRREAEAIAKNAAEALRRSSEERMRESWNVPTWTGRAGMAGAPAVVREGLGGGGGRFGNVKKGPAGGGGSGAILGGFGDQAVEQAEGGGGREGERGAGAGAKEKEAGFGSGRSAGFMGLRDAPKSSKELLDVMKKRGLSADPVARNAAEGRQEEEDWALVIMNDLRAFMLQESGGRRQGDLARWTAGRQQQRVQIATGTLLAAFKARVPPHRQGLFRTCLQTIARKIDDDGKTCWKLKADFG